MRCKPGCLAYVVGPSFYTPEIVGRIVIVDRLVQPGEEVLPGCVWHPPFEPTWWIRPAVAGDRLPWSLAPGVTLDVAERILLDSLLRPITPDDGQLAEWAEGWQDALELAHG